MLYKKLEPVTRTFSAATRQVLNKLAVKIDDAKLYADMADGMRRETREMLTDLFGLEAAPGSVAYCVDGLPHKGSIVCLDLAVRYEPDMDKLRKVLGDRIAAVTVTEPVFNRKTAEASIRAGIVTEEELAKCLTPKARPSAVLRDAGDSMTPKGIEPGEGRVNPLVLVKGLKLDWGERS